MFSFLLLSTTIFKDSDFVRRYPVFNLKNINKVKANNFDINAEWYYSEFTTTTPTYRLIGFELSRELEHIERMQLIQYLSDKFQGYVLPQ